MVSRCGTSTFILLYVWVMDRSRLFQRPWVPVGATVASGGRRVLAASRGRREASCVRRAWGRGGAGLLCTQTRGAELFRVRVGVGSLRAPVRKAGGGGGVRPCGHSPRARVSSPRLDSRGAGFFRRFRD